MSEQLMEIRLWCKMSAREMSHLRRCMLDLGLLFSQKIHELIFCCCQKAASCTQHTLHNHGTMPWLNYTSRGEFFLKHWVGYFISRSALLFCYRLLLVWRGKMCRPSRAVYFRPPPPHQCHREVVKVNVACYKVPYKVSFRLLETETICIKELKTLASVRQCILSLLILTQVLYIPKDVIRYIKHTIEWVSHHWENFWFWVFWIALSEPLSLLVILSSCLSHACISVCFLGTYVLHTMVKEEREDLANCQKDYNVCSTQLMLASTHLLLLQIHYCEHPIHITVA